MTIDTAYTEVERLVKKFKLLSPQARKAYNEDNTRKGFILQHQLRRSHRQASA